MSHSSTDAWFVRLPDSRVVRANSTRSVRHHIETGTFPPGSHARRSPRERWTPLHRLEPFADLLAEHTRSRRQNRERQAELAEPSADTDTLWQLQAIGVHVLIQELTNALDSTLTRRKLMVAGCTALLFGLLVVIQNVALNMLGQPWGLYGAMGQGLVALVAGAFCTTLLTQLTFIELSQLRPAKLGEAIQNLSIHVLRLLICYFLVIGGIIGVLYLIHWLPGLLEEESSANRETLLLAAVVLQILLEVILLPLLGFALLLGPLVVIEETSVLRSLRQWCGLIRVHLRRLFLYEALAAAVALVASLPFAVPVAFAAMNAPGHSTPALVAHIVLDLLWALACTPALAYLIVANVFIYLHLRYESPQAR